MRILCAAVVALVTVSLCSAAEPLPMPTPDAKLPSYACAASNAAVKTPNWECPTCGHEGPCPKHEKPGRCGRLWNWMFYRSSIKGNGCCPPCEQPQGPPLFAWFPCNSGCGGCGTCSAVDANACRGAACKACRPAKGGFWKNRCAKGMCGTYKIAELCKNHRGRFLYTDGSCGIPAEGFDATPPVVAPPAANTPTAPVQTTSYKVSAENAQQVRQAVKPVTPRTTTYRPEAIKQQMPVLSPDQFRKPKKPQ